jgi:DHA2 family multidrug resistance protein
MFVLGGISIPLMAMLPTLLQNFFGFPVLESGLMMIPRGIGMIVPMLGGARLMKIFDLRTMIVAGFVLTAGSMWSMSGWSLDMGTGPMIVTGLVQGVGLGLIFAPMNIAAFSSMSAIDRPDGSSLFSLVRSLGSSIGISLMVNTLARNQQASHSDLAALVTDSTTAGLAYPAASTALPGSAAVVTLIDAEVNRQAAMIAYNNIFYACSWLLLVMALTAFFIRKSDINSSAPAETMME